MIWHWHCVWYLLSFVIRIWKRLIVIWIRLRAIIIFVKAVHRERYASFAEACSRYLLMKIWQFKNDSTVRHSLEKKSLQIEVVANPDAAIIFQIKCCDTAQYWITATSLHVTVNIKLGHTHGQHRTVLRLISSVAVRGLYNQPSFNDLTPASFQIRPQA